MTRYVAFLRAVNVGGRVVKMDRLRELFAAVPLDEVATFIASGNVLFSSRKTARALEPAIEKVLKAALGYEVATMIRAAAELSAVVRHVETRKFEHGGGTVLYVGFLKTAPPPAVVTQVTALSNDVDTLEVHDAQVYWQCRKSFGESTIVGPKLEKLLGGPVTFRNFNTVRKLAERTAA